MLIPPVIQYSDIAVMATGPFTPGDDLLSNLFRFVVLFVLGAVFCKLFKAVKGTGRIFYCLGFVMVIISVSNLIIEFFS